QIYGGKPDVILFGAGLQLIFDNAYNPGLEWTHYDILLEEGAGWHLNSLTGPVPTEAQFRAVLSDLAGLRIRGEYRPLDDFGGLDNVSLESVFDFDLDGDDNSGAFDGDFLADTLCFPTGSIADIDALLISGKPVDSIVIRILYANAGEMLEPGPVPGTIDLAFANPQQLALINAGNAPTADFLAAIGQIQYSDQSPKPVRGERLIEFRVYTECGEVAIRYAYLPVYPPPDAGMDGDTLLCAGGDPVFLPDVPAGDPGGYWSPALAGGDYFDPDRDAPGTYRYIIPGAGGCPGDTAALVIGVEQGFDLGADTVICYDDVLTLTIPSGLSAWQWQDGSTGPTLSVTGPGAYALSGQTAACAFSDSLQVDFYTCRECPFYAPNIFSPNDDGINDLWQVFLPCAWLDFRLDVFDRWGNLVFSADDPEKGWNGRSKGKIAMPGVYVWRLTWTGERYGEQKTYRDEGDVTLLR
ncbi:MAG: gliding motility-associated C-terminal domain-containing protein, partial [Saprospiraceae bacterium]|nr:gliding motility-associated C-terminal domain-containing protein [Saprospiraceae bacterium]